MNNSEKAGTTILIVLACLLAGLLFFQPKEYFSYKGIVVGRQYTPSRYWVTYSEQCQTVNKTTTCTTIPQNHYEPEHFYLDVFGNDKTQTFAVSADRYSRSYVNDTTVTVQCSRGQWISFVLCDLE